jgi:histidyl-tRNA synthetase
MVQERAVIEPRTPPGVMELLPSEQLAFQRMLDTIRRGFERFGFLPIETPTFELADVLLTKSGGETEKQVYFVQSTGALDQGKRPELALRFDLTVPLARYVAEHEHELNFPFRRYQIQRVYRGERAQKGRFREFYQCDIDVIGKDALPIAYDAELPAVIAGIFDELAIGEYVIRINNRRLLRGLIEAHMAADQLAVLHEIDRLGKQSREEVLARLITIVPPDSATWLLDLLTDPDPLQALSRVDCSNEAFVTGRDELRAVYDGTLALGVPPSRIVVDLSIARGLDYYTGTVYETFLVGNERLGSICSGGRYDNLAEHYTKSKLPGVGISIGVTRLFSYLLERGVAAASTAQVVVFHLEPALARDYAGIAAELRAGGLNVDVYAVDDKLGKQFKYAERAGIPLAIIYGSKERDANTVKVKQLAHKVEHDVPRTELVARVRALL